MALTEILIKDQDSRHLYILFFLESAQVQEIASVIHQSDMIAVARTDYRSILSIVLGFIDNDIRQRHDSLFTRYHPSAEISIELRFRQTENGPERSGYGRLIEIAPFAFINS